MVGGYIQVNNVGDIVNYSKNYINGGININNETLFEQICQKPYEYKWLNDKLIQTTRPSIYHNWNGSQWFLDTNYIQSCRLAIAADIKNLRDHKLTDGGYPTSVGWFHSDAEAQLNYEDLYKNRSNLALTPIQSRLWKKMDGSFVVMTEAIVNEIFAIKASQKMGIFAKAEQHQLAVMQSSDPLNYDYTTGWPLIFGE